MLLILCNICVKETFQLVLKNEKRCVKVSNIPMHIIHFVDDALIVANNPETKKMVISRHHDNVPLNIKEEINEAGPKFKYIGSFLNAGRTLKRN